MAEPFWVMMRILAVCAAVVLSFLLYHVAKAAWLHYKSGQYSTEPSRLFRFRTRRANGAIYERVEFQDDGEDEGGDDGLVVDEGYHDAESVTASPSSSRKSSPLLLQKPLPERPLPDKPLPPVPPQVPDE